MITSVCCGRLKSMTFREIRHFWSIQFFLCVFLDCLSASSAIFCLYRIALVCKPFFNLCLIKFNLCLHFIELKFFSFLYEKKRSFRMATHREHEKQWFLGKYYSSNLVYRKKITLWTNEKNRKMGIEDFGQTFVFVQAICISIVCKNLFE